MVHKSKALEDIISRQAEALARSLREKIFKACCLTETTGQRTITDGLTFEFFELIFSSWKLTKTLSQRSPSTAKVSTRTIVRDTSAIPLFHPYLGRGVATPPKRKKRHYKKRTESKPLPRQPKPTVTRSRKEIFQQTEQPTEPKKQTRELKLGEKLSTWLNFTEFSKPNSKFQGFDGVKVHGRLGTDFVFVTGASASWHNQKVNIKFTTWKLNSSHFLLGPFDRPTESL